MRKAIAATVLLVLVAMISVLPLVACPYAQPQSARSDHSCCPKAPAQPSHCPMSPSVDRCPFFLSEHKMTIAVELTTDLLPLMTRESPSPLSEAASHKPQPETHASGASEIYLRNRVLRI